MSTSSADPIEAISDPDKLRRMLADTVQRSHLLRSLLKLAERKRTCEVRIQTAHPHQLEITRDTSR